MSERVVVTGANRGLGLELTRVWTDRGYDVVAGCRRPADAAELAETGATVLEVDTGDASSIAAFAASIGDAPVDILVNNAGVDARAFGVAGDRRDALQVDGEVVLDVMRINVVGPMLVTRSLVPNLRAAGGARLIDVSSQVGSMEVGRNVGRDVAYTASKAALNMVMLKFAGLLEADGVITIALHPGHLRTAMGGPNAPLEPSEAAARIVDTIDGLTPDQNGSFLRWDGTVHPW
jgi:NAD(P)-dependent dehydrogenase (short-subunit alcohol dehydrogenase family)